VVSKIDKMRENESGWSGHEVITRETEATRVTKEIVVVVVCRGKVVEKKGGVT